MVEHARNACLICTHIIPSGNHRAIKYFHVFLLNNGTTLGNPRFQTGPYVHPFEQGGFYLSWLMIPEDYYDSIANILWIYHFPLWDSPS